MNTEITGYRFIDPSADRDGDEDPTPIFSVEFYPSLDDYVHIATNRSQNRPVSSWTKLALQFFYAANAIIIPAILLFLGYGWLALGVFMANLVLVVFLLPATTKVDFRHYFESLYPNIENELVRIELSESGLKTVHDDGVGIYPWKTITAIEVGENSVYFYLKGTGIAVRKNGFTYAEQIKQFVDFARSHLPRVDQPRLRNDY